ncbi:MAG: hypothetical protein IPN33_05325 [Saprospiraceae bacterium]|nr:hypothetical protein [Saprospiraceae bacterium]
MRKIHSETDLKNAIADLENKQEEEGKMLKEDFHNAYEDVKPVKIIVNTLRDAFESSELKDQLLITSVGLAAGYISKKMFVRESHGEVKKIIAAALVFGITNYIAKHPEEVKLAGRIAINFIRNTFRSGKRQAHNDQTASKLLTAET